MERMSSGNGTSDFCAFLSFSRSDHPLHRIHLTPAFLTDSMTVSVRAFGSETTIDPNPMYTIFLLSARAFAIKSTISCCGSHFFFVVLSESSRNQYPVTIIQSTQSNGGGTTEGLKLYKNGTLWACSLSIFVLRNPKCRFLHRL